MTQTVSLGMLDSAAGDLGFRNKIINGCGWIDQRNSNAPVSINSTANTFGPDRWAGYGANADGVFALTGSKASYALNGTGMPSSIVCQTTTADVSIGAAQTYGLRYVVEAQDIAHWRMGTALASTVTLSFRVLSTKAGTHCVAFSNNANNRNYVATYTVNAASTWEYKTITLPLDTAGTWLTDNGAGIKLFWNMGSGSSYIAPTANTWQAGQYYAVAGAQNVIDTINAVLAITDVQLELGKAATAFETRPVEVELALCQRYYYRITHAAVSLPFGYAYAYSTTQAQAAINYPVPMRTAPTALEQSGTANKYEITGVSTITCSAVPVHGGSTTNTIGIVNTTVASGLTAGDAGLLRADSTNGVGAYLGWSAEL